MCLCLKNRYENIVAQFNFKASGAAIVHVARWFFAFPIKNTSSPFSSAKSYWASQASCMVGATQPAAPLQDASVA